MRSATRRSFEVVVSDRPQRRRRANNDRLPTPEHLMPDLDDPEAVAALVRGYLDDRRRRAATIGGVAP